MAKLEKGAKVEFHRSHDKTHKLSGTVVETRGGEVLVKTAPAGVLVWTDNKHCAAVEKEEKEQKDE